MTVCCSESSAEHLLESLLGQPVRAIFWGSGINGETVGRQYFVLLNFLVDVTYPTHSGWVCI